MISHKLLGQESEGDLGLKIRQDLETISPDFSWEEFLASAESRWADYIPGPTAKRLLSFSWSHLVPKSLREPKKMALLIKKAWNLEKDFRKKRSELHKYIVVGGTMGTGKSEFVHALAGFRPFEAKYFSEAWEDNDELQMFYRLLGIWADPTCRTSKSYRRITHDLKEVQGKAQSWFAARKFIQALISMFDLPNFSVIQDTPLWQDGVYAETQYELELASEKNIVAYRKDNLLRQKLLPSYLKWPTLVYVWAPFEVTRERVLKSRGRDFESQVPEGYLLRLHQNTLQWMLAMKRMGVPVLMVDAGTSDFRPGMSDRLPVVAKIWQEIDKIK